jgi:hypothetical protein
MGGDGFDGLCDLGQVEYFGLLLIDQWSEDDVNVIRHHNYGVKIKPDLIVMRAYVEDHRPGPVR